MSQSSENVHQFYQLFHQLTAHILRYDHSEFRNHENLVRKAGISKILDGGMLAQFLEFMSMQQESASALPLGSVATVTLDLNKILLSIISVNRVVQLLERVYYALN